MVNLQSSDGQHWETAVPLKGSWWLNHKPTRVLDALLCRLVGRLLRLSPVDPKPEEKR